MSLRPVKTSDRLVFNRLSPGSLSGPPGLPGLQVAVQPEAGCLALHVHPELRILQHLWSLLHPPWHEPRFHAQQYSLPDASLEANFPLPLPFGRCCWRWFWACWPRFPLPLVQDPLWDVRDEPFFLPFPFVSPAAESPASWVDIRIGVQNR